MLWFEKGDPEELKGRGILYTHNLGGVDGDEDNAMYPACLFGATPTELIRVIRSYSGVSPEEGKVIMESYQNWTNSFFKARKVNKENLDSILEGIREAGKQSPDVPEEVKGMVEGFVEKMGQIEESAKNLTFGCGVALEYDRNLTEGIEGDVIQIATIPEIRYAEPLLQKVLTLYLPVYSIQQEGRMAGPEGYVSSVKNFQELTREEFAKEFHRLSGKLMYAMECGTGVGEVTADLKQLSKGSPFIGDMVNFYKIAQTTHPKKEEIMDRYSRKVTAIIRNEFEEAERLREEIDELLG